MSLTPAVQLWTVWPKRGLSAIIDLVEGSHLRAAAFLVAICLLSYLPGFFSIPPVDRDEARFVQATKQMLETGDYVDIRFQDDVRYKKPVGIYWLQAAVVQAAQVLGVADPQRSVWLYRVPSLIGATGSVLLTYWTVLAFESRRAACLAGLMLASSLVLGVEARLAKTDAMLLLTVVAAMGVLARAYVSAPSATPDGVFSARGAVGLGAGILPSSERRRFVRLSALFWTAVAGGIMLKGPLIVMIVGLAATSLAILERSAQWLLRLRPVFGTLLLLVLVLPWFFAIIARTGTTFFVQSIGEDFLSKLASGQEAHGAPPGAYLLMFWVTFWPAAPLAALAAPAVIMEHRTRPVRFLLAWLVPSWIVFELVTTKLPHYVLPLYPAIAILIARELERGGLSKDRRLVRSTALWPIVATILPAAGVIGVMLLTRQMAWLAWPCGALGIFFAVLAGWLRNADGPERSLLRASLSALLVSMAVLGVAVPLMRPLFPSAAVALAIPLNCDHPQFASAGYHEPSVVFLFGTSTRLTDGQGAADFLSSGGCRYALIESRQERSFLERAEAIGLRYVQGPRVEGIDLSVGHQVAIAVYHPERRE